MPHFFISYAKKDTRQLALHLNDALDALPDVTAWVDKSLKAGQSWELQIQKEIDRCDYMIVLYSPDINRHKGGEEESYMLSEIHYAKRIARKQIIPVMAQTTEPPMSLVMEQYIDFTLPDLGVQDLVKAICDEVGIVEEEIIPSNASLSIVENTIVVGDRLQAKGTVRDTSLSLMPQPFAWIDIPHKGYSIAKYPITNAQFAKFIEVGGYNNREWWTDAGWEARNHGWSYEKAKVTWTKSDRTWDEPRFWTDKDWNTPLQPIVGISWYEAAAFCTWLSTVTLETIKLPNSEQWQYAAQGDDKYVFPWGNAWDSDRCNNSVKPRDSDFTTSVNAFEGKGDSPFGVVDMAGNVWEWCLDDHSSKIKDFDTKVIRGGSWQYQKEDFFRCDAIYGTPTINRTEDLGFRICRLI